MKPSASKRRMLPKGNLYGNMKREMKASGRQRRFGLTITPISFKARFVGHSE